MTPDTDVAAAALRIKRAVMDKETAATLEDSDAKFYLDLLNLSLKLLDHTVSESKKFSWAWLGPEYVAPVLFACLAIVVKWLEERLTRYLMKKYNIRLPSIYSVTITILHFL